VNYSSPTTIRDFSKTLGQLGDVLVQSGMLVPTCLLLFLLLVAVFFILLGAWNGKSLIDKEFREQSARKRTYVMRTLYAIGIFVGAWLVSHDDLARVQREGMDALGAGTDLFEVFTLIQFVGIYLFTPAMTCSLLTSEKERDTLSLLMLTRLNPWGMILGKLISRIVPMILFAGLSMPLCAFAYSLGGVDPTMIQMAILTMCLSILQCAALGVMCSAIFRTTVGAFIASYVLGFVLLAGLPMLDEVFGIARKLHNLLSDMYGGYDFLGYSRYEFALMFIPPALLETNSRSIWHGLLQAFPSMVSIIAMLYAARFFVIRRAFAQPRNMLLGLFRWVDRLFVKINDRFARGVVLSTSNDGLPVDDPIAWRETTKKTLGTPRYLVRVLVGLEFPVALVCALSVADSGRPTAPLSLMLIPVWVISTLLLAVSSASLVSSERSRQTLDVLLTTPLSNQAILRQKFKGVRRLMLVLSVPFFTIYLFQVWLKIGSPELAQPEYSINSNSSLDHTAAVMTYIIGSAVTTFLYFNMVALVSMFIGLSVRSQAKAIFTTLGTLVGWCVLPIMLILLSDTLFHASDGITEIAILASPAAVIPMIETHRFADPIFSICLNTMIYGSITIVFYWYVLYARHGLLGRLDTRRKQPLAEPQTPSTMFQE
jgi:hypothetical protein